MHQNAPTVEHIKWEHLSEPALADFAGSARRLLGQWKVIMAEAVTAGHKEHTGEIKGFSGSSDAYRDIG